MKICFVAMNIYPCLAEKPNYQMLGGAEMQQKYIAACLNERGYDISFIVKDFGQQTIEKIGDMDVYKTYKSNTGMPFIRFFYPYVFKTWKAMKKADADVYYVRCAGNLVGIVCLFCKIYKKKYIFAGAHDNDFKPDLIMLKHSLEKRLYCLALKKADKIIVQTNEQKELLKKNHGLDGILIRNFSTMKPKSLPMNEKGIILWVSTIRSWKRPDWFINLSDHFPNEHFVMIGGLKNDEADLYEHVKESARRRGNLEFLGFQPLEITETYFDRCKVFVNTSEYEGFPNTFLQAWRRGIPVISCVDPDNLITKNELGIRANTEKELKKALHYVLHETKTKEATIKTYFTQNHTEVNIDKFEDMLASI